MKAFVVERYGKKHAIRMAERPEPAPGEDEVLVEIHAASVNPLDAMLRAGEFKLLLPYKLPLILGNDFAGVVIRVGARVRSFKPGDEVYARTDTDRAGSFAERIAIRESSLAHKPKTLSMEQAASIPLVGLTAWQALIDQASVKAGQKVLIHAGSGGVGSFAIQLAKHLGATVATTTSTANVGWVKGLGADVVVDYKTQAFEQVLGGYDFALNSLKGDTLERSLRVLKPGALAISLSGPPDKAFAQALGLNGMLQLVMSLLSFGIRRKAAARQLRYSFLFMRPSGEQLAKIAALVDAGTIRPVVDRLFPFESTPDALAYVEQGRAKGKVVIKIK
ncbi:MAG: NADPH:quinone oxidoreductase [Xanthomonadaceae bacterium]|nr:NADPH:quinone oxidoreductase [Xanthomonadaceae bacterium]